MGQGFSLTAPPAGAAGIDVPELADLTYEKVIGQARFMKSIRARHNDGVVLVKVLVKPYAMSLGRFKKKIIRERNALASVPNALPYQRAIETETNGYLVRQFFYNSLYDRLSTRPFLEDMEKRWLAFQLLCALRDCHAKEIYHGDIKTENTLVTSWNWLYISDFSSSFKPVMLPEDNPADFSYFFDTSGRRTCYLAPERFLPPGQDPDPNAKITWAMDVFSAGCVIAELFLETPIFNLSQLYKYRRGEYDPSISHLSRIPDKDLREMIAHMIQVDPQKRYSAEQYLDFWKDKVFPGYFYNFLHQYMQSITDLSTGNSRIGEADQRIERVWNDFDKISYFLGYANGNDPHEHHLPSPRLGLGLFPVRLNIPNAEHHVSANKQPATDDGTLIFLTLVASSLRNTAHATAKIKACDIMLAFAERLTDEAKLDRVLPYLMTLLTDKCDRVAISALRTITQLLNLVKIITPVNSHIFLEYILPRMQVALLGSQGTPSPVVRATYAACLGKLATTAYRFLAMAATLRADGSVTISDPELEPGNETNTALDGLFDSSRQDLVDLFETHTKMLIEDLNPFVRRAFLSSVPDLCIFFGVAKANDVIIAHLNTYLNDRDWMLRYAFFDTVVGISAFMGSSTLESFILPLIIQAVDDPEEFVVQGALQSLAELTRLGLLTKEAFVDLVALVRRFTMHPNIWIREAAAHFIAAGNEFLSSAYLKVSVYPQLKPFLKPDIIPGWSELQLLDSLQKPLSRNVFELAMQWAAKSEKSGFWKPPKRLWDARAVTKLSKTDEDEQWLGRLRTAGLSQADEIKLIMLREFIWRLVQMKGRDSTELQMEKRSELEDIIPLRNLGITPQTVMFEEEPIRYPAPQLDDDDTAPKTIQEALLDASLTIGDPLSQRRRAAVDKQKSKSGSRSNLPSISVDGRLATDSNGEGSRDTLRRSASHQSRASLLSPHDDVGSAHYPPYETRRALKHQSSAMSLMNRKDSAKSVPETGTTETNAFGEVEAPLSQHYQGTHIRSADTESVPPTPGIKLRVNHDYHGNDPHILKMLDTMYVENYPHDLAEFGPEVTPIGRRKTGKIISSQPGKQRENGWKPKGVTIASFVEHVGAINRIVVAPDHQFFLTGGDDGAVKVWDSARFEKINIHKSRLTHRHAPGAKVRALCFIENTHSFVSCATDGSVHIVKVETYLQGESYRYTRLRTVREHRFVDGEFGVWCEHYKRDNESILIVATNKSVVWGIELRTMTLLFKLENPVHHGTPTCFCIDFKKNWLCLGTSHGVLDLWDLRFKVKLKSWGVPGKGSIYRLAIHPSRGRGRWVCASGGTGQGEVTVWDIEKATCREVYRVGGNKEGPKGYDAWQVDEDKPSDGQGQMLSRFATNIEPNAMGNADRGVRALVFGWGITDAATVEEQPPPPLQERDVRYAFMVTGGSDKKLRFWDLTHVSQSRIYSGLQLGEAAPSYTASHPTPSLILNTERLHGKSSGDQTGGSGTAGTGRGNSVAQGANGKSSSSSNSARNAQQKMRPSRTKIISQEHFRLLRSHLDSVLDVALLESPYPMTVSCDRGGMVLIIR
ncbi:phosphoinositide 3-kinase [Neurospora intermedia]|uniref:non-specific serine/threonine protein kinase n=1 Tax=Neurospora intermedia TaxID=5142 RepID=A0ABR3DID6_NEUIN